MKNKKLFNAVCGIITLLILAGSVWFLTVWLKQIEPKQHVIELIVFAVVLVLLLALTLIFFYNTTAHSAKFAVKKGFNLTFSFITFAASFLIVAFGVSQIVSYYKAAEKSASVLTYGIAAVVIGLVALLVSLFIKRRNFKIVATEQKLKKYDAEPEKVETFNDKKINRTCPYCGCRLKPEDTHCPNCTSKLD